MADKENNEEAKELAKKKQVLFSPKLGMFWRINPEDDCEIQFAWQPGEWITFGGLIFHEKRYAISELTLADDQSSNDDCSVIFATCDEASEVFKIHLNGKGLRSAKNHVLFSPESGTYWRINPDDDCEIQSASNPNGEWKTFQRFAAPIIELFADNEHKCAAVTIKQYRKIYLHLEDK